MGTPERKKEIIEVCLKIFMEKGLAHTSTRDLCKALDMKPSNIFYYFESKDEIIHLCIEEARLKIETDLFGVALEDIEQPAKLAKSLQERAIKHRPLMKFFVSACATDKYDKAVERSLDKLSLRYRTYIQRFAEKLSCGEEEVAPYVYIVINTMLSFMLFGKNGFVAPQLDLVYNKMLELLDKRDNEG